MKQNLFTSNIFRILFVLAVPFLFFQVMVLNDPVIATPKAETILIPQEASKRVLVPHNDIGNDWFRNVNFNHSQWWPCDGEPGGIGYEKNSGYENLISLDVGAEMHVDGGNPNPSCYIRIRFELSAGERAQAHFLLLKMRYDDGFIAYLNGKRVAAANAPPNPAWNSVSTDDQEAGEPIGFNISGHVDDLLVGPNLLAIHGLNHNNESSDFLITAELVATDNLFGDFTSSRLPLILINTNGQPIPDPEKIEAEMKIIDNGPSALNRPTDPATDYDGKIGIEIRGAYSSTFPQKPYSIETRDETGNNLNVPLLGMPAENDWALITNYNEKSFARTTLAFDMFREMGHYAPRAVLCEAFVNNIYQGIYVFTEKIKRDKNRVDISKLRPEENIGDDLTGGYIIKIDYHHSNDSWLSNYSPLGYPGRRVYFIYYYPKPDEITSEQKTYIQNFMAAFEDALYGDDFADPQTGYRHYIDVPSFIDYFLVSEISRNVDGYKKSRFLYKDRDSKNRLLYAGPVWDFDWAWKNIRECFYANTDGSGWSFRTNDCNPDVYPPGWYVRLIQDGYFTKKLINRYWELRNTIFNLNRIFTYIDSVAAYVEAAQARHFAIWPIDRDYKAPEVDPPVHSYSEEITKLKNWIQLRVHWLDKNIPELRNQIIAPVSSDEAASPPPAAFRLFPNPAADCFYVQSDQPIGKIQLFNLLGQEVYCADLNQVKLAKIQIHGLQSGMYLVRIVGADEQVQVLKHIFQK